MPIPNRRKPRIYKGSMPPQQPKKQHMPPKYGNPDDGGRNELPMPERTAECRMQGQQQYIMEPTHTTPGKIRGTGAAPLWSKDTLAQEAKIPDAGDAPKAAEANQHNQAKFRVRRNGPIRLWAQRRQAAAGCKRPHLAAPKTNLHLKFQMQGDGPRRSG